MTAYLSVICAIVGVVLYFASTNTKLSDIGRLMFFAGLFVFLMQTQKTLHF